MQAAPVALDTRQSQSQTESCARAKSPEYGDLNHFAPVSVPDIEAQCLHGMSGAANAGNCAAGTAISAAMPGTRPGPGLSCGLARQARRRLAEARSQ